MRVLVTGGAGFIGSHLIESIVAMDNEVDVLDNFHTGRRENVELSGKVSHLYVQDVSEALLRSPQYDRIYHLACPASPVHYQSDPVHTFKTAVFGTHRMLELARSTGARLLIASTSEVYGDPLEHPQTEKYWGNVNPVGPRSCYDEGKRGAETLASDYARTLGVDLRIVRIFNTYGPRMLFDDGRVVSNFIHQALLGKPLTVYGEGLQTRSFCYVSDLVRGILLLMESNVSAIPVNLGNPNEFTIRELAMMILSKTASSSSIVNHPMPTDDPGRRCPDISRAKDLLSWSPKIELSEGLDLTIEEFRKRLVP